MEHRLGADVDAGAGAAPRRRVPVTATTGRPAAASSSSRRRVTPGGGWRTPTRPHTLAHGRPHRAAATAHERAVVGQPDGRVAALAAQQRLDRRGRPGCAPGPGRCARTPRCARRPRRWAISGEVTSDVFHGSSRLRSTTSTIGHRPLVVDRRARQPDPDRGERRSPSGTATPGAPAPRARRARSTSDVAGVPRRAALLLQRLVVLVEHDHRGEAGARRPCRDAGADDDVDAGRRRRPLLRAHGDAESGPAQADAVEAGPVGRRHDHERRPPPGRGQQQPAATSRSVAAAASRPRRRAAAPVVRRSAGSGRVPVRRPGGSPATLVGGLAVTRNGRSRPAAQRTDAHRASVDQPGRRADATLTLVIGLSSRQVDGTGGRVERDHPSPDTPPVQRHAHVRPEAHVQHEPSGTT